MAKKQDDPKQAVILKKMATMQELVKDNPRINLSSTLTDVELTDEQKSIVTNLWNSHKDNPPSIEEMCEATYGQKYEPRSRPIMVLRAFIAESGERAKSEAVQKEDLRKQNAKDNPIVFSEEDKRLIFTNCIEGPVETRMRPFAAARLIFKNDNLTPFSREARAVYAFIKEQDPKILMVEDDYEEKGYTPPKQLVQAAFRINRHIYEGTIKDRSWETNNQVKGKLDHVIKLCHHPRFVLLASKLMVKEERDMFEGSFIRYIFDKFDLTPEEIDLYIDVCQDTVDELKINNEVNVYTEILNDLNQGQDKRGALAIGEHLAALRDSLSKNKTRRKSLIDTLQGKRSERIDLKIKANSSLANLVEAMRHEESRNEIIEIARKGKEKLGNEITKLENLEQIKALIAGISREEILYG